MRKNAITFRLDADRVRDLDAVAAGLDRDRSYVIVEAVRSYLELYHWQLEEIKAGIKDADEGRFATDAEVAAAFARMRKGKR